MTNKITINQVDIGFDIGEEIHKAIKSEISKEVINDIADVMTAISNKPENKKAIEKIETENKLEETVQLMLINSKISKDDLVKKFDNRNINSIIGLLRNYASKYHNKELVRQKDYYVFAS